MMICLTYQRGCIRPYVRHGFILLIGGTHEYMRDTDGHSVAMWINSLSTESKKLVSKASFNVVSEAP